MVTTWGCGRWRVCVGVGLLVMLSALHQAKAQELPADKGVASPLLAKLTGEIDGHYAFNQTTYSTRSLAVSSDAALKMIQSELDGEFRFEREVIKVSGTAREVNTDKFDTNLKYKQFLTDSAFYAYVSPRIRQNRFGFYQRAQGMRVGGGRRFGGDEIWEVSLEVGTGYRWAHLSTNESISEALYLVSAKARWAINSNLSVKLNWIGEGGDREAYQTISLGLRNKLSDKLGLKYEMLYRRAFTASDTVQSAGELLTEMGISYSF